LRGNRGCERFGCGACENCNLAHSENQRDEMRYYLSRKTGLAQVRGDSGNR
jgi:hypothetical protein